MEKQNINTQEQVSQELEKKLDDAVVESLLSDNGSLTLIIKEGLDLKEYASLAKVVLENKGEVAHDYTGRVVNESRTAHADFYYQSGWPLDGLASGELE